MYRKGVSALIINKKEEFLLVNLESFEEKYFAIPGGGVEEGETLEDAVYREIQEELSIAKTSLAYVGRSNLPLQFKFEVVTLTRDGKEYEGSERYFFGFRFIGNDNEIKPQKGEVRAHKWVPFSELNMYLLFDNQLADTSKKIAEIFPFFKMEINSTIKSPAGEILKVVYRESDPYQNLDGKILQAVHAYCFWDDKMVVVYSEKKGYWTPPGGGIEKGETFEEAVVREVKEETNMKVLKQVLIGYQDIYETTRIVRQVRSVCMVEPYGDFVADPDGGEITEIKLIDPKDYKQYFDWGIVGDRIMEQALKLSKIYRNNHEKEVLGIDIGNVIINHRLRDYNDKTLLEERYSTIPATEGVFDAIRKLNSEKFQGNIFLISKCSEWAQEKILAWLKDHDFYVKTGVKPNNVLFCRERHEKDKICKDNNITYFIDDRLEVLSHMVNTVPNLFLYQPFQEEIEQYKEFLPKVVRVESWAEVLERIV